MALFACVFFGLGGKLWPEVSVTKITRTSEHKRAFVKLNVGRKENASEPDGITSGMGGGSSVFIVLRINVCAYDLTPIHDYDSAA